MSSYIAITSVIPSGAPYLAFALRRRLRGAARGNCPAAVRESPVCGTARFRPSTHGCPNRAAVEKAKLRLDTPAVGQGYGCTPRQRRGRFFAPRSRWLRLYRQQRRRSALNDRRRRRRNVVEKRKCGDSRGTRLPVPKKSFISNMFRELKPGVSTLSAM